jgi:hypothetical protein
MVGVSMIRAHVLFGQGDQKEDLRILDDEPRVPDRLAKSETERRSIVDNEAREDVALSIK